MTDAYFEPLGDGRFRATEHTSGPWDPGSQHAGPPSALLARALEALAPDPARMLARVTLEILGPVPVDEVEVQAAVVRPGRSVEMLEAELLERELPERKGKVLVDVSRNAPEELVLAPYSLRGKRSHLAVSLPVGWDEVEQAVADGDESPFRYGPDEAIERVERVGDLWAAALNLTQRLPSF